MKAKMANFITKKNLISNIDNVEEFKRQFLFNIMSESLVDRNLPDEIVKLICEYHDPISLIRGQLIEIYLFNQSMIGSFIQEFNDYYHISWSYVDDNLKSSIDETVFNEYEKNHFLQFAKLKDEYKKNLFKNEVNQEFPKFWPGDYGYGYYIDGLWSGEPVNFNNTLNVPIVIFLKNIKNIPTSQLAKLAKINKIRNRSKLKTRDDYYNAFLKL